MSLPTLRRRHLAILLAILVLTTACRATPTVTATGVATGETAALDSTDFDGGDVSIDDAPGDLVEALDPDGDRPDKGAKDDAAETNPDREPSSSGRESPLDDAPTPAPESDSADNPFADRVNGGGIDFRLTRDDVECEEDDLNTYPDTPFLVAHVVVDGNLGEPCFGEPDERLTRSWQVLAAITPPGQLHDLGLFGGYVSAERGETTLAFVNTLDVEGSLYQMSINLDEAEADPDELMLTMAHEFSHVFTSLSTQLDRLTFPEDCPTWDNGEGCYREDALMWAWIQRFWGDGLIDQIDPFGEPTSAGGSARCSLNAGFLGSYAASSPEEDFAESFSAFVFRLDVPSPELQAKMEWFAQQPGLVEFRNLAVEAGFGPLRNYFERCG